MNLKNNTILITGGTSGLGFEFTKQLLEMGNTVIITGRNQTKLDQTKKQFPNVHIFQSDVSEIKSSTLNCSALISKMGRAETLAGKFKGFSALRKVFLLF